MTDSKQEALSALLDGEAHSHEIDGLLRDLQRNEAAAQTLARYSLIGHCLRGEAIHSQSLEIQAAVSRRIQDEPAILAMPRPVVTGSHSRWWRPAAGLAIAASVATLAVVLVPQVMQQPQSTVAFETVAEVYSPAVAPPSIQAVSHEQQQTRWTHGQPEIESRLNSYLADHNEFSGPGGISGLIPYASFVSYDGGQ